MTPREAVDYLRGIVPAGDEKAKEALAAIDLGPIPDFYGKTMNLTTAWRVMDYSMTLGNFKEISKAYRETIYRMCEDLTGSENHIYQATALQQKIRADIDLFVQSVVDGTEFNKDYFKKNI